jgi:hypothetical protein
MKGRQKVKSRLLKRCLVQFLVATFFFSMMSPAQTKNQKPSYTDEIIPLRGKPFKGKILKIDGTTLYVEITKYKVVQIITLDIDSLKEVKKNFGSMKVEVLNRNAQKNSVHALTVSPIIKMPGQVSNDVRKDTVRLP